MSKIGHLPRNGQYEIFTYSGWTHCFDDTELDSIKTPPGMFEWIRSQDPKLWHGMSHYPDENAAFYLEPKLYLLWKLKWA
jgi:hypothetical protein